MFFTIPNGAKPSKAASTDKTRAILCVGNVMRDDAGWWLEVTNSYCLARVPLLPRDEANDPPARAGTLSPEALRAVEAKGAGGFRILEDGSVQVTDTNGLLRASLPAAPTGGKTFPNLARLMPDFAGRETITLAVNVDLLLAVRAAYGGRKGDAVQVEVAVPLADERSVTRPLRVDMVASTPAFGVVMPFRVVEPRVTAPVAA